jgi:hypothetical protein
MFATLNKEYEIRHVRSCATVLPHNDGIEEFVSSGLSKTIVARWSESNTVGRMIHKRRSSSSAKPSDEGMDAAAPGAMTAADQ